MDKNYKYDAFISYRHNDLDKFVAENLHRLIETYKMPKPVIEKYNITSEELSHYNDIDNIKPGIKLIIPSVDE